MSANIEVTEYTGNVSLQLGNADLADSCDWEPPTSTERAGLPGEEHKAALHMTWTDRLAMAGCYALVFGVLPAMLWGRA